MLTILTVLVGSHAHGLALPTSDYDKRGVFIQPTVDLLRLGGGPEETHVGADQLPDSNPLKAVALDLIKRYDAAYGSGGRNAFVGYGMSQRKRFLDRRDIRSGKYAAAYLRSLFWGYELLTTGTFTMRVVDTEIGPQVEQFKMGFYTVDEVLSVCDGWAEKVEAAFLAHPDKVTDLAPVNDYLLRMRRKHWGAAGFDAP
ncbi:MAG: nucleotidyltransferase domain-containing protein [Chloroflexi bacterium]|nr:nucleotidyltransferase domain-containing protein [Chloroflexota bacterium]